MVLTLPGRPAVVVPDEATWTMAGHDPANRGFVPVAGAGNAEALLAPAHLPKPLAGAVAGEWRRAGGRLHVVTEDAFDLNGSPLESVLAEDPEHHHAAEGHEHAAGGHDHGDHGDMMAITGDASADGLVMEPIDFPFGPLSAVLPGGLVAEVSLDGDVIARCEVRATLRSGVDGPEAVPDPLSPIAWAVADLVARGTHAPAEVQWEWLAAIELERALSHAAWLRSFARALGWAQLVDAAQRAVTALVPLHGMPPHAFGAGSVRSAAPAVAALSRLATTRRFASRTRGRGYAAGEALAGPNGRASGHAVDARMHDPLYEQLGFTPVLEQDGDALARAHVRLREAEASLALAGAALERSGAALERSGEPGPPAAYAVGTAGRGADPAARIEGPRGPLVVAAGGARATPRAGAAPAAAGAAATGLEWSAALVTLASFDLSPWTVGA